MLLDLSLQLNKAILSPNLQPVLKVKLDVNFSSESWL